MDNKYYDLIVVKKLLIQECNITANEVGNGLSL